MRRILITALLAAHLATPAWAFGQPLHVSIGRSEVIKTHEPILRVAISDPAIADVVVLPDKEVLINGKAGGSTNLMVWTKTGRQTFQVQVGQDFDGLLPNLERMTGSKDLSIHNANGTLVLMGTVRTPKLKALAEKVASTYAQKVISELNVPPSEQLQVNILVVEVAKTATKELGVTWGTRQVTDLKNGVETAIFRPLASQFLEGVLGGSGVAALTGLGGLLRDPLTARLDLMVKENKAKVLARPTLVANSGAPAKFLAGGEIPIPVQQALGMTTILWKEYGVRLETEPTLLDDGKIALKVKPEVSSLDYNNGVTVNGFRVPALKTRRAETEVRLSPGESLALGGLLSKDDAHNVTKLPLLGDIPILGELFKSHQFLNGESELMIIVTPNVVQANRSGPVTGVEQRSEEFRTWMQELDKTSATPPSGQAAVPPVSTPPSKPVAPSAVTIETSTIAEPVQAPGSPDGSPATVPTPSAVGK